MNAMEWLQCMDCDVLNAMKRIQCNKWNIRMYCDVCNVINAMWCMQHNECNTIYCIEHNVCNIIHSI